MSKTKRKKTGTKRKKKLVYMGSEPYYAAVEGEIDVLTELKAQRELLAINPREANLDRLLTPRYNTILHIHILARPQRMESTQFVQRVLKMRPTLLFEANTKGEIPLHVAAKYGHVGVVKALIKRAKSLCEISVYKQHMLWVTNDEKNTALHEAVRMNHIDVVRLLVAEDPDYLYSGNTAGETPLYLAAERGYNDIAYELLERCKSPAHGGSHGRTTLHAAVIRQDSEMTRRILTKTGSSLTSEVDEEGWTPLHYSTQNEFIANFIMLLAVDKSAAYIASKDKQWTPLHIAVRTGYINIVTELILQCPDCVELVDHQGWNILHHAIDKNEFRCLSFLLKNPVISKLLNDKDTRGNTPVHQLASTTIGHAYYSDAFFPLAPLVDKNALNDMDQTPLDILLEDDQTANINNEKISFTKEMKRNGFKQSIQNKIEGDKAMRSQINQLRSSDDKAPKKKRNIFRESYRVVAMLIATEIFVAGFTSSPPGDYISGDHDGRRHDHRGLEIFSKKRAFQAFVICHSVAMVSSICRAYHDLMFARAGQNKIASHFYGTYLSSIIAMGAMVLAFAAGAYVLLFLINGAYVLLGHSKLLTISTIIIILLFYLYFKGHMNKFFQRVRV